MPADLFLYCVVEGRLILHIPALIRVSVQLLMMTNSNAHSSKLDNNASKSSLVISAIPFMTECIESTLVIVLKLALLVGLMVPPGAVP